MKDAPGVALPIKIGNGSYTLYAAPLKRSGTFAEAIEACEDFVFLGPPSSATGLAVILDKNGRTTGLFVPDAVPDEELRQHQMDARPVIEALRDGVFNELFVERSFPFR